jgi:hypothetical protein
MGEQLKGAAYQKAAVGAGSFYSGAEAGVVGRFYSGTCDGTTGFDSSSCAAGNVHGEGCSQPQVDEGVVSYYAQKILDDTDDCPLGRGAEVFFGDSVSSSIRGLYQMETDGSFTHIDGLGHTIVKEPPSAGAECGWAIKELVPAAITSTAEFEDCEDDDLALNFLLGQCDDPETCETTDPDYEAELCETLMTVWSDVNKGYCSDPIFAGVCRETCASEIGAANCGADLDTITALSTDYVCGECETPADIALCPVTCAGDERRLKGKAVGKAVRHAATRNFARRLSTLYTTARKSGTERRLQASEVIAYKSCGECGGECSAALPSGGWRSWKTLHECVSGHVDVTCADVTQFIVYEMMYCSLGNIRTLNHPNALIRDNSCHTKCGTRTEDRIDPVTGVPDYCSGNRGIVGKDDDAICVPQEQCEEICEQEEDCISFDKHRRYHRCYLNRVCPETGGTSVCNLENCKRTARRPSPNGLANGFEHEPSCYGTNNVCGDGVCTCTEATFGTCTCGYNLMIADEPHQFDMWLKYHSDRRPAVYKAEYVDHMSTGHTAVGEDGRGIINQIMPGPSYFNYQGSLMQAQPIDNVRIKFVTHTGTDCLADADRLARVDIDSWTAFVAAGSGLEFESQDGLFTSLDQYIGTPMKGYRRACELFCRESDICAGFQYTPLVVTTAHGTGNNARYQSDSPNLRRRRGAGQPAHASHTNGIDTEVDELDDIIYLPDGICQFFRWTDNVVVDGALNGCLTPANGTTVTDGTGPAGTYSQFIDLPTGNFSYQRPTMFVQKVVPPMCTATVTGLPDDAVQFEGDYVKSPQRRRLTHPAIWEKVDNTAAIVFSSDDASTVCDSWAIYEYLGRTTTPLEVCVDFPEVLAAYMANGTVVASSFPPNLQMDFTPLEFPCQTGADKGYCDNYVFAGLCPHSCQPMIPFTGDQGFRTSYMQTHGYQSFTETPAPQQWQSQQKTMYENTARYQALFGDDSCAAPDDDAGYCNANCTTGPYNKITDCTDCLGASSAFCNPTAAQQLSRSTCGADNNVAMFFFAFESSWIDEVDNVLNSHSPGTRVAGGLLPWSQFREEMTSACNNLIRVVFFDDANYPCDPNPRMNYLVVRALCPTTCAMTGPTTPAPAAPLDEADAPGASRRTTTSWSGKMTGLGDLTATFDYEYPATPLDLSVAANKRLVFRSYSYTTSISSTPVPHSSVCTNTNTMAPGSPRDYVEAANAFAILSDIDNNGQCWYRTSLMQVEPSDLVVQQICRGYSACPELMTCALSPSRFHDELEIWRYSIGLLRTTHLMPIDGPTKDQLLSTSHYVPKVITTASRAEAIMTGSTTSYFKSIHRTAPGATRLTVVDDPAATETGEYLVVVLFSAAAGYEEGGHGYELPMAADYDPTPLSDVIRIERFASDTTPMEAGKFTVDLEFPGLDVEAGELDVFLFPVVVGAPATSILGMPGVSLGLSPDGEKIRLTVPSIAGDFLVVQDKDECDEAPAKCDALVGICENTMPGYSCSCPETHFCVGPDCATCKMKTQGMSNYYLKLSHTSRLDYGWRVKQVQFFPTDDCSGAAVTAGISAATSLADHGLGSAKSYPGGHGPGNVAAAATEWWSACITCNPDALIDETHGGPAQLECVVDSTVDVRCIKVDQGSVSELYGGHASRGLKVERGPAGGAGHPTMTVTASCGDGPDDCSSTSIALGCGMPDTLLWGEVLEPPGTEQYGFFGSYGQDGGVAGTLSVPSACHCHELCISHVASMCRSYKFFEEGNVKHCVLQTSEFFTYTDGVAGAPPGSVVSSIASYTSGTPMDRFASAVVGKPRVLGAAKPWVESFTFDDGVITINGYGFPTKNAVTKADRGRYQRVKVVAKGAPCSSEVPNAVSGIGCVSTQLKTYAEPHQHAMYAGADGTSAGPYRRGREDRSG